MTLTEIKFCDVFVSSLTCRAQVSFLLNAQCLRSGGEKYTLLLDWTPRFSELLSGLKHFQFAFGLKSDCDKKTSNLILMNYPNNICLAFSYTNLDVSDLLICLTLTLCFYFLYLFKVDFSNISCYSAHGLKKTTLWGVMQFLNMNIYFKQIQLVL